MRTLPCSNHRRFLFGFTVLCCLAGFQHAASAAETATVTPIGQLYETARRAVVEVLVNDHLNGSGCFVDGSGLAITAAHVIEATDARIELLTTNAGRVKATVLAVDRGHDLALLQAAARDIDYPALPLAAAMPKAGQQVFLIGTPIFRHTVMLPGRMARAQPTFEYLPDQQNYVHCFHVAGLAPKGCSGGVWFDRRGAVVGVQSSSMTVGDAAQGVQFIAPLSAVRSLLLHRENVATATLGVAIEETWQQQRDFLDRLAPGTEGLVLRIVRKDGPAQRAGLKQWDIIVAADGQPVRLPDELLRLVRSKQPGQKLKVEVLDPDNGTRREVEILLDRI